MAAINLTEVIVALIGAAGIIFVALVGRVRLKAKSNELNQAHTEMSFQRDAMDFSAYMEEWNSTQSELSALIQETNIDRFMILRAWNGSMSPKWTTAIYQYREGDQKPVSYVHFELDQDYISRIQQMVGKGSIHFDVSAIDDSYIKDVYDAEGVKHALWYHIETLSRPGTDSKAITYCSFASHKDEPFSKEVATRCMIFAGRLKGLASHFGSIK